MKYLSFLLCFICALGYAQRPYTAMLHEDAHWVSGHPNIERDALLTYEITIKGDTTIGGLLYKKIFSRPVIRFKDGRNGAFRYLYTDTTTLEAFSREDTTDRKVYMIFRTSNSLLTPLQQCQTDVELLWYDFSLEAGESVPNCGYVGPSSDTLSNISMDSTFEGSSFPLEVISNPRNRYDIIQNRGTNEFSFWEGIGKQKGFLNSYINGIAQTQENQMLLFCRDSLLGCKDRFVKSVSSSPVRPYRSLLFEDAHWIVSRGLDAYETTIGGDTIVARTRYKKVYNQSLQSYVTGSDKPPYYRSGKREIEALLREDTASRKVYAIFLKAGSNSLNRSPCTPGQEVLLYDFTTEVLDTIVHCQSRTTYQYAREYRPSGEAVRDMNAITGIDSLQYFYFAFKAKDLGLSEANDRVHIEGIGSSYGLLETGIAWSGSRRLAYYCRESLGGCPEFWLVNNEDPSNSYLNWEVTQDYTRQVLRIRFPQDRPDAVVLYDLSGREVMRKAVERQSELEVSLAQFPAGMYVVGAEANHRIVRRKKVIR
ncbi:MAG: T9SS type A sorting domain-containing protein [Bacteroidota bacterium]